MSLRTLEIVDLQDDDHLASQVSGFWELTQTSKLNVVYMWDEIRKYMFAVDTDHTSGEHNPWKNRTTRPKLTWIYDKMLTAYVKKLLPNDEFFRWKSSPGTKGKVKANAIQHFMKRKVRHPLVAMRKMVTQCLSDWLLTGNTFAGVEYIKEYQKNLVTGEKELIFKGAKPFRINPMDAVLDSAADTWEQSFFAFRRLIKREEFFAYVEENPDEYDKEAVEKIKAGHFGSYGADVVDYLKENNRTIEGVTIYDHWNSGRVELIKYYGAIYDKEEETFKINQEIVLGDRLFILKKGDNPSYIANKTVVYSGFRKRPDNLWSQGPFDNLMGLQYRIDHEENAKADALDACVYPIIKVTGDASDEEYQIKPGEVWHVPLNGKVELEYPDPRTFMFEQDIIGKEQIMEEFSGMPRETAGFRTPGEKTGYEVKALLDNAGEHPDEKLAQFESDFLEPLLNLMLELNIRNLDEADVESFRDEDVETWGKITIEDLRVDGRLYPVGIKHSKERADKIGKIQMLLEMGAQYAPQHTKLYRELQLLEEELNLEEEDIVEFGGGYMETVEFQQLQGQLEESMQREDMNATPQQLATADGGAS